MAAFPGERVMGRDELNIAEFPVALLSPANANQRTLTANRTITLPNGRRVEQIWEVSGSDSKGLPISADQDVLIALLKLGSDQGFNSSKVFFSRSQIASVIGWKKNGWSMDRISASIERYAGTIISTRQAFWRKDRQQWISHKGFSIIDAYEITQCPDREHLSWVRFGEEFFQSLAAGYIKPIDLTFYYALKTPLSKRLFRYLDKHQYRRSSHQVALQTLASANMGLTETTTKRAATIKRTLESAHNELIALGFLKDVRYTKTTEGWRVTYDFPPRLEKTLETAPDPTTTALNGLRTFGISTSVAQELLHLKPLDFILRQMDVFRYMIAVAPKAFRNQAGFLTKAIREEWHLNPPGYGTPRRLTATVALETPEALKLEPSRPDLDAILTELSPSEVEELRVEALAQAQADMGRVIKLKAETPMVESYFKALVKARYLDGASRP